MTDKTHRETATIYQFPIKPRLSNAARQAASRPTAEMPVRQARVESGSGWYHDAAIRDAEQARHY